MKNKPLINSYWVVPEKFLAGEYPYNQGGENPENSLKNLLKSGVSVFIDLTEEDEMGPYKRKLTSLCPNIEYFRFPIEDRSITSLKSVQEILKKIDDCLDNDKTIYLHCYGGIGRTGLIVGCWLASKYKSGKVALEKLKSLWMDNPKSKWTDSPETEEQKQFVLNWKQ